MTALRGIVTVGDPRLIVPCAPAGQADVGPMLDRLAAVLRELVGAGLAAPQIGEPLRVAVVEVRRTPTFPDRPETGLIELVDPVVVERSDDVLVDTEGCFSVPGYVGRVPRAASVTIENTLRDGSRVTQVYEGYVARVVQHEIDHLDGRTYLHRMTDLTTFATTENWLAHRQD